MKFLLLFVLAGIGIGLWQGLLPNTLYRKHVCRDGWTEKGAIHVKFDSKWQNVTFKGYEFSLEKLKKKSYYPIPPLDLKGAKGEHARYFLNFDRCRYLGIKYGNPFFNEGSIIDGPEMVATNEHCNGTLYYVPNVRGRSWEEFPTNVHANFDCKKVND